MWILNFIPLWIVHAVFSISVALFLATYFLTKLPFISTYAKIIRPVSFALMLGMIWYEGGLSNQAAWEARVKEMQAKVAKAEAESLEANKKLNSKVIKKIDLVKGTTNENIKIVREIVSKNDSKCELSNAFVVLHNSASQNVISPSARELPAGASNVKASQLLETVTENYGLYYQQREIIKGWQEWYKEQKNIFEEVSK